MRSSTQKIIITSTIIAIVIGGGVYDWQHSTQATKTTESELRVYENKQDHYSFRYPSNYKISIENDSVVNLDPPGEEPNPYSSAQGEGTNPSDDIIVKKVKIDSTEEFFKQPTILDAREVPSSFNGTQGYAFIENGETGNFNYLFPLGENYFLDLETAESSKKLTELVKTLVISNKII